MKYRADVAGVKDSRWGKNAMEYDSPEEVKEWLNGLKNRWFGYDMARIVTVDTPYGEVIDMEDETIYQNFRS